MKIYHSASEGTQGSISRGGKRGNREQDSNWDAEIPVTGTQGFAAPGSSSSCADVDPGHGQGLWMEARNEITLHYSLLVMVFIIFYYHGSLMFNREFMLICG